MQIGIVDSSDENLADLFEKYVYQRVEQVVSKKKNALDLFDALAFLKQFEKMDQRVLIVKLIRDEEQQAKAFFEALANLEATTGKMIFKCIYYDDENGEAAIQETADQFLKYLFKIVPKSKEEYKKLPLP